jgi:hypothetical protein
MIRESTLEEINNDIDILEKKVNEDFVFYQKVLSELLSVTQKRTLTKDDVLKYIDDLNGIVYNIKHDSFYLGSTKQLLCYKKKERINE